MTSGLFFIFPAQPRRALGGAWPAGAALALALLAACSATPPAISPDLQNYRSFLVEEPVPALQAAGAVALSYKGQTESGELFLRTAPRGTLIQLKARVTGALAIEVRFDTRQLLVLDYVSKTYYQGGNTPETRRSLFGIDLAPEEFRTVVTGRVLRRDFERGRGTLLGPHQAAYRNGDARYIFTLGEDGLPTAWVKQSNGEMQYRVEYRGYVEVPAGTGPSVRLPERVRVYVAEGKPAIVLGLREFSAPRTVPELTFSLPPEAADFHPE